MKGYCLNIAGYMLKVISRGPDLVPGKRFRQFMISSSASQGISPDEDIKKLFVYSGSTNLPAEAVKVFDAPYVEEAGGVRTEKNNDFWSVWQVNDGLFIRIVFQPPSSLKEALISFSTGSNDWKLVVSGNTGSIDPLEYPTDGLILYYLSMLNNDIMLHASGVMHEGRGYVFSGISGRGKSTIASIWAKAGAQVVHDDRLIIRKRNGKYYFHNTPVYENEARAGSPLDRIYIIEHGSRNVVNPVTGAEAVSLVISNCIQHHWSRQIVAGLLDSVSSLCENIPVSRLAFVPDHSVIGKILENEQQEQKP